MLEKIIIASGPVIIEDNKVLLNQHGDTTFWKFCGGKVEKNETLINIAKREVMEEMGIEIEILNETPYFFYTTKKMPNGTADVILVHFLSRRIGEIKPGKDIRKWDWIEIDKLKSEPLAPNIISTLKHFGFY